MDRTGYAMTILAMGAVMAALYLVFFVAPLEATLGVSQKIFYFHVGSAIHMMVTFGVCGLAGLAYLVSMGGAPRVAEWADAIGVATAEVGVMLGAVVLVTGPLWARKAWGTWWTWEPRLTLSLMVFLLFLAYLALRSFAGEDRFARAVGSGLAILGLPAIYLIHYAVERWGGAHPQVVYKGGLQQPEMRLAFGVSVLAVGLTAWALVILRLVLERQRREVDRLFLEADRRMG
ncbi:cytochrome c biogenesis protein CcsA [Myxococcota bacterium]|nr:cytochrome c biogenesis protein CcsA [Myxococcota bacterium]